MTENAPAQPPAPPTPPAPPVYAAPPADVAPPAYAAPPAYGAPAQGQYAVAAASTPTNTMAIISLVASIVGILMFPIVGSIVGIVLAYQARKQIAVTREGGAGMATAGLIIGWIGIALWVVGGLIWFAFVVLIFATS